MTILSCRHWLVSSSRKLNPSNPTRTARQYPVSAYREIASARLIRLARPEGFEPQPSDPKPPGPAEGRRGRALTSANNGSLPLFRSIHHCSNRVPGMRADQSIASPAFRRIRSDKDGRDVIRESAAACAEGCRGAAASCRSSPRTVSATLSMSSISLVCQVYSCPTKGYLDPEVEKSLQSGARDMPVARRNSSTFHSTRGPQLNLFQSG